MVLDIVVFSDAHTWGNRNRVNARSQADHALAGGFESLAEQFLGRQEAAYFIAEYRLRRPNLEPRSSYRRQSLSGTGCLRCLELRKRC